LTRGVIHRSQPSAHRASAQLRRDLTPAEAILWKRLRSRQFADFKFRRQHPIGPFYADFVCNQCLLVIELDGETHLTTADADAERSRYLHANGWLVLRFWNTQVFDELEAVLEAIYRACRERELMNPQKGC
jgi:very-short-patch-repair endonuclease